MALVIITQAALSGRVLSNPSSVVVTQAKGEITISTSRALSQRSLKGMPLAQDDQISTGADGQLDIAINALVGCRLLPSTTCRIIQTQKDRMSLSVVEGNVILNLRQLPSNSSFILETPTAIAAVRGTQFWGRVIPGGEAIQSPGTTFAVREGTIQVIDKSSRKYFDLHQGQALDLSGQTLPVIRPALDDELEAMKQAAEIQTSI